MRRASGIRSTPSRGNGTSELDLVWSGLKDDGALLSHLRACRRCKRALVRSCPAITARHVLLRSVMSGSIQPNMVGTTVGQTRRAL